ncbi:MAG: SLBB domain-containing protein [Pseudomonadota bacterium]
MLEPTPGSANSRRRATSLLLAGSTLLLSILLPWASVAQSVSQAQVQRLMQLPPAERERLMRSLGLSPADLAALIPGGVALESEAGSTSDALDGANPLLGEPRAQEELTPAAEDTLEPESTLLIGFAPVDPRTIDPGNTDEDVDLLPGFLMELVGQRRYELDRYGVLHLQRVFHIELAGLTAKQAAMRIQAEPGLDAFVVFVELLPLKRTGTDALALYGSDFLSRADTLLFDPAATAVPGNYVVGPSDVLLVSFYGADSQSFELTVDREGRVVLPQIGPVTVAGLPLDDVRDEIRTRVAEQMIGINTTVTIKRLRAIQVLVTGDVKGHGVITVDSLTTIANALLLSGGVEDNGSLRRVQLKRDGRVVTTLDLYDLLLRGDTRDNQRLRSGDVVFVPPIGPVAGVEGAINRPARYELRGETTVEQLLALAGGASAEAQLGNARLERILPSGGRTVIDIDLSRDSDRRLTVRNGDVLRVIPAQSLARGVVSLQGHVREPREFQWRDGMRLTDLITSAADLREFADTNYILIRRLDEMGQLSVATADLRQALVAPRSAENPLLRPGDHVTVFQLNRDRSGVIGPLLKALDDQGQFGTPLAVAVVVGEVRVSGRYPIVPGMRISDLLRAAGGLGENAFTSAAVLTRRIIVPGQDADTQFLSVDLDRVLAGDEQADLILQARDHLLVKTVPEIANADKVTLSGEVRFPGTYPVARGETLADLVERAGGLTDYAFAAGATFTRVGLRQREQERLQQLARRLESDLAVAAVQGAQSPAGGGNAGEALRLGQELLEQIRETPAVGRLVIDLERLVSEGHGSPADLVLRDGDQLMVPELSQEVTVIGQVQFPGSHLYDPQKVLEEYLDKAGNTTKQADRKRIYVVRANGEVVTSKNSRWFRGDQIPISYGDTIVVPLDADRMRPLALWSTISSVLYQLGLSAATARAVGVF